MGKQKVALVLSMGGARGIAHIGVIEELLRHNYEITSIAGSSMGAMVGAMYASGKLEECKEWLYSWDKRKMWELADLTLSRDGLVKGDRFIKELKEIIPDMNIEDLPIPYVAMATNIVCDQEVRFDSGSLHEAIRASISIPMLFRPLRKDGMVLVDKAEGDKVSAATVNQSGFIKCRATRVGEDTTLSQIIQMVSDAAATKAPIAKIADKVSGVFVPAVITTAVITFIVWMLAGQTFGYALARAISVLVISCPCAKNLPQ